MEKEVNLSTKKCKVVTLSDLISKDYIMVKSGLLCCQFYFSTLKDFNIVLGNDCFICIFKLFLGYWIIIIF